LKLKDYRDGNTDDTDKADGRGFFSIEDDKHRLHRFTSKSKTLRTLRTPLRALRLKSTIELNTDDTDKADGRGFFSIEDDKHKLHRFTSKSKTLRT
jgi:hypothetical protein